MSLQVGFAEVDITPPVGTHKIGWLRDLVSDHVLDPLFARAAVLEDDSGPPPPAEAGIGAREGGQVGFVQLDTLSIRWTQVADMRRRIEKAYGFPGAHIMVAATHNHAGPAVATTGEVRRDDAYIEALVQKVVGAFGQALESRQQAEVGWGSARQFGVGFQRRVIMRDGTVRCHGSLAEDPDALCFEGPIDPEVAVLAARSTSGQPLGTIVNFACHVTHHGGDTALSAGYPGVLAAEMKSGGWPVTLFLNGAAGNIAPTDPTRPGGYTVTMEEAGKRLAADAMQVVEHMEFRGAAKLGCASRTVQLPFRRVTEDEVRGTVKGAQRFIDPAIYDRNMHRVLERIRRQGTQPAEVQAIGIGDRAYVAIPAEYFVQHGLRIKEKTYPRHTLVVAYANGMVGYVPHREAFERGGYETTFFGSSRLAPEAGDVLADAAIELVMREL